MTDKELIKQEIERLKEHTAKCGYPGQGEFENGNREGRNWACNKLLKFIDSLPEEPKCIYNRTLDERKKFCKYCSAACDVRIEEEPETEDLIEEIDKIWKTCNPIDEGMGVETANIHIEQFDDIARHFAEWQKQQMKEALQTEYEKGRFDKQQEMMKDAVDGEYWDGSIYLDNRPTEYKDGDKVKIIIVKTEQQ